jgi:anti-anti-sigma regulatory factor
VSSIVVSIRQLVGDFAADKDKARELRQVFITPALKKGVEVVLDFEGVEFATQSFVHALISAPLRAVGEEGLGLLVFIECSEAVEAIIETVVDYTLFIPDPTK